MEEISEKKQKSPPKRRKKGDGTAVIVLLALTTVISASLAGAFGALYIQLRAENKELKAEISSAEAVVTISESVEETSTQEASEDSVEVMGESETQEEASGALLADEEAIEASIKERMKELVTEEDGSPIKMLRSFFPENLIYVDENEYVFAPVLDDVDKHELLEENFVETDEGEMQYVVDGEVVSHKGIDVSKYQGDIDWEAVAEDGVEYAFVRLGIRGYVSGKIVLDEYFEQNVSGAEAAGVDVGVYFFTQAVTVDEALEEAEFVLENLEGYDISYPVVFDVEMITDGDGRANSLSQEERTDITIAFCDKIREAGYTPMIYGNIKCFTKLLDMTRLNDYEKWYAFYDNYMYMPYDVGIWQYTEKGSVAGISTKVDLNIAYKSYGTEG